MKMSLLACTHILLLFSGAAYSEATEYKKIDNIKLSGKDGYIYFLAEGGKWGGEDCPQAIYAYISQDSVLLSKEMLSVALAAKMSKTNIKFVGNCDETGIYFKIKDMWLD